MRTFYITAIALLTYMNTIGQTFQFSLSFLGINETTNNYQVAFIATPSSPVTDAAMDDMGGGFYLPSGLTIGNFAVGNSGLPATEWISQSLGSNSNGDAYFVSRVEVGGSSVSLNGSGPFQLVLFEIIADPNPTTGTINLVENGDPVFDSLFIQNYINLNLGSGPADAYLQNDPTANSLDFSTLSVENEPFLDDLSLYPNPTSSQLYVKGNISLINSIEILSITGQSVLRIQNDFDTIDIAYFEAGFYFVKLNGINSSKIIKLIKY